MKFLCGRPGCGKESTATLQIDAPSSTVSLVDPRISRDGVPLCARHADATTPPMGWSMNDLRSRNRALSAVPDGEEANGGSAVGDGPKRPSGRRMSRRQSIAERARAQRSGETAADADNADATDNPAALAGGGDVDTADRNGSTEADHRFSASRPAAASNGDKPADDGQILPTGGTSTNLDEAPSSRPSRRRDPGDDEQPEEDRFPWRYKFEDDEPEELQASTPLLSRAFRATIG